MDVETLGTGLALDASDDGAAGEGGPNSKLTTAERSDARALLAVLTTEAATNAAELHSDNGATLRLLADKREEAASKNLDARRKLFRGGQATATELTNRDQEICERLGPELKARGLIFAGIDVIGGAAQLGQECFHDCAIGLVVFCNQDSGRYLDMLR